MRTSTAAAAAAASTLLIVLMVHSPRATSASAAFVAVPHRSSRVGFRPAHRSTVLNLDPRIARLVDEEYYRETHLDEYDKKFHERNDPLIEHDLPQGYDADESDLAEPVLHRQQVKDRRLARDDPQKYCADRCLSTGYCDAFEDFFEFTPEEVLEFCTDCVLSEDEEPCDIPYEAMDKHLESEANGEKLAP